MFATYEPLKFPLQFDDDSTIWLGVEIMLNTAWLLATLEDEEVPRTFLLRGPDDLLKIVQNPGFGRLTGLRVVLPPEVSPTNDWAFVPVCRVERELRSIGGAIPSAVLTCAEGRRYGGFPIALTERDDTDLALVVDLSTGAT